MGLERSRVAMSMPWRLMLCLRVIVRSSPRHLVYIVIKNSGRCWRGPQSQAGRPCGGPETLACLVSVVRHEVMMVVEEVVAVMAFGGGFQLPSTCMSSVLFLSHLTSVRPSHMFPPFR